jgi:hypothetical protein
MMTLEPEVTAFAIGLEARALASFASFASFAFAFATFSWRAFAVKVSV